MTFGNTIFKFYSNLNLPDDSPNRIEILHPFLNPETLLINKAFYRKYFQDTNARTFLIGINPGRFGAGITGIPFTDPINLENILEIPSDFDKKHELSSKFIYSVIKGMNGPDVFYKNFYFTSISPVGFISKGKNINYYDTKELMTETWESFFLKSLTIQIEAGANTDCAYSLGTGKNIKYLEYLNNKYKLFKKVVPLPHPRWVMQYRFKKRDEFVRLYTETLSGHIPA